MATSNRLDDRLRTRDLEGELDEDPLATKVVFMELVDASRPLSLEELRARTRLTEATVRSALVALAGVGICAKTDPGGGRDPRYRFVG